MGQRIVVDGRRVVEDSIIISTDRSLTGTDGEGFDSLEQASAGATFPAKLAVELFEADDATTRVYVSQNVVVITRDGGWDGVADAAARVVEEFFLFYPEG